MSAVAGPDAPTTARIAQLEQTVSEQQETISELLTVIKEIRGDITDVFGRLNTTNEQVDDNAERIDENRSYLSDHESRLTETNNRVTKLEQRVREDAEGNGKDHAKINKRLTALENGDHAVDSGSGGDDDPEATQPLSKADALVKHSPKMCDTVNEVRTRMILQNVTDIAKRVSIKDDRGYVLSWSDIKTCLVGAMDKKVYDTYISRIFGVFAEAERDAPDHVKIRKGLNSKNSRTGETRVWLSTDVVKNIVAFEHANTTTNTNRVD